MAEPRSVAIVSAVAPYPVDSGKKLVLAGLLSYWVARLGAEHVHYVLVGGDPAHGPDLPGPVHRVAGPTTGEKMLSLTWRTVMTRRHTVQESMLYGRRVRTRLSATLRSIDADVEIYDTVRMGQYAPEAPARPGQRRMIYLDDLFSLRYARMLDLLAARRDVGLDPLGEFRSHVPRPLAALVGLRPVLRRVLDAERRLVARREVEAVRDFSAAMLVSPAETALLSTLTGRPTVRVLPPVVDVEPVARGYDGGSEFVLLGLLSLPHNHDAAMTFLTDTLPAVLPRLPDVRVRIVGRGASPELLAAAARYPGHVTVEGFVSDLDQVLSSACALLAPLRFGSGVKIKVIEALGRGVPVLATEFGAEGVRGGVDSGVIVEPDLHRHPDVMVALRDPEFNARVSEGARRQYDRSYSRAAIHRQYDEIFDDPSMRAVATS